LVNTPKKGLCSLFHPTTFLPPLLHPQPQITSTLLESICLEYLPSVVPGAPRSCSQTHFVSARYHWSFLVLPRFGRAKPAARRLPLCVNAPVRLKFADGAHTGAIPPLPELLSFVSSSFFRLAFFFPSFFRSVRTIAPYRNLRTSPLPASVPPPISIEPDDLPRPVVSKLCRSYRCGGRRKSGCALIPVLARREESRQPDEVVGTGGGLEDSSLSVPISCGTLRRIGRRRFHLTFARFEPNPGLHLNKPSAAAQEVHHLCFEQPDSFQQESPGALVA